MGIAAYRRGNAAISRGICRAYECPGCGRCRTPARPTPRPKEWGFKAAERARMIADRVLASALAYDLPAPSVETLASVVRDRAAVGLATATRAAKCAIEDT